MKTIEQEIWKPVAGYKKCYSVSISGKVKRIKPANGATVGMERKFHKDHKGYLRVQLCENGKRVAWKVHKLVAITFLGKSPKGLQVNHKDGIKTNNHASNLEYITQGENIRHAWKLGLYKIRNGEKSNRAKLKEKDVLEIRKLFSKNVYTRTELSKIYKTSRKTIYSITNRETWTHI